MALNNLYYADLPVGNYLLTNSLTYTDKKANAA